jgi:hypothetical protein
MFQWERRGIEGGGGGEGVNFDTLLNILLFGDDKVLVSVSEDDLWKALYICTTLQNSPE